MSGHHKREERRAERRCQCPVCRSDWFVEICAWLIVGLLACWTVHLFAKRAIAESVSSTLPPGRTDLARISGKPAGVGSPAGNTLGLVFAPPMRAPDIGPIKPLSAQAGLSSGVEGHAALHTGQCTSPKGIGAGGYREGRRAVNAAPYPSGSRNQVRPAQSFVPGPMVPDWRAIWLRDESNGSTVDDTPPPQETR